MEKIQFPVLKVDGSNYLSWTLNVEIVLNAKGIGDTIIADDGDLQTKAQTVYIIRHHLDPKLQTQYIDEYNPRALWDALNRRFDHLRLISLPAVGNDWIHLRVLDHPTITSYNSALFRITSQLKVCGYAVAEFEQIEKTLLTFPTGSMTLAQQYRQMHFTNYSDLIAVMLVAKKTDLLLIQNAKSRPPGTIRDLNLNTRHRFPRTKEITMSMDRTMAITIAMDGTMAITMAKDANTRDSRTIDLPKVASQIKENPHFPIN